jgi:hypothetical protein
MSGNVVAEPVRDQPRVKIVAAADAVANVEVDGLAAVEIGDILRARRADLRQRHSQSNADFAPLAKLLAITVMLFLSRPSARDRSRSPAGDKRRLASRRRDIARVGEIP